MFRECSGLRVRVGSRVILYLNSVTILLPFRSQFCYHFGHNSVTISVTILLPFRSQFCFHFGHNSVTISVTTLLPFRSQLCYHFCHNSVTISVTTLLPFRSQFCYHFGHNSVTISVTTLLPILLPILIATLKSIIRINSATILLAKLKSIIRANNQSQIGHNSVSKVEVNLFPQNSVTKYKPILKPTLKQIIWNKKK
jgi:hypothetical protein